MLCVDSLVLLAYISLTNLSSTWCEDPGCFARANSFNNKLAFNFESVLEDETRYVCFNSVMLHLTVCA